MKKVFDKIDSLNDEFVNVWEDVCAIESPSDYKEGVDEVGRYFMKLSEKNSWDIEVFKQENLGDAICIVMNPEAKKPLVVLSGHMDTVHPVGSFGEPVTWREGDLLHGPGAVDCKGGIVAGFLAMQALSECGFKERPIMMLLQGNEEIGSGLNNKESIKYMCKKAEKAAAFLNLEGYGANSRGKACLKRKGIAGFLFTVTGIEVHASACAKGGASAILEAAHKIIELEKVKNDDGLTFNCGVIKGGTVSNTVSGKCEFKLDVRFSTEEEYKEALKIVERVKNTVYVEGCKCEVTQTNLRTAMELNDRNINLLNKMNEIFEKNGFSPLEMCSRAGGSDAADVSACGIPVVDNIGTEGGNIHSKGEFGVISSLSESAKRLACVIAGL